MTKEEAFALYGDVPLKFSSYYKYTFTYTGTAPDGALIVLNVGGAAENIYRYSVTPDSTARLNEECGYSAQITKDGAPIFDFYDF